ncbi:MAG TPA: FkbM family methyltransferase [Thermoanaerobaculia bacterium]|nr:FkbM family methyltransferase [Thermoanaerobaculia bacterium]
MKPKELLYALGFRPRPREYPFEIDSVTLPKEGVLRFARWRHPNEDPKEFEQEEVDALRGFLREGDVAIDIGAHTGDSTLPIALAVGASGTVLAFEPNPYAFKVLLANSELNRDRTRIVPLPVAVTPEDGTFTFEYSDAGFCNGGLHEGISALRHHHFIKLAVEGRNLVRLMERDYPDELRRLRFVKTDTEGYDRKVVASLAPLLTSQRPVLKCEVYRHLPEAERAGFYRDLRRAGYRVFKWESPAVFRGEELSERRMTAWRHFDLVAFPEEAVA